MVDTTNHGLRSSNGAFSEGHIYSLGASLTPSKIVSCRYLSLQPRIKLKSPARVWGRWPPPSTTVCFLHFSSLSICCSTGLPFVPRADQTLTMRLVNSHWPLDEVVNSTSFPNPSAPIKTFLGVPGWLRPRVS